MADVDRVRVAATGEIYVAPVGTPQPTDLTALGEGWTELGFVTTDGVSQTDSKDMNELRAWQSFYPIKRIVTGKDLRVAFTLMEFSEETVLLAYGGGEVTEPSAGIFKYSPPAPETIDERMAVVDFHENDITYRIVFPRMMVVESIESQLMREDSVNLPITLGLLGEAGTDAWYFLTNDPDFPEGS